MKKGTGLQDRLDFGKHRGKTLEEVIEEDPRYIRWALREIDRFDITEAAEAYLEQVEA